MTTDEVIMLLTVIAVPVVPTLFMMWKEHREHRRRCGVILGRIKGMFDPDSPHSQMFARLTQIDQMRDNLRRLADEEDRKQESSNLNRKPNTP